MYQRALLMVGLLGLLLLSGCASVQELRDRRIDDNRSLFDSLPAESQQQIRRGEIALGFTPEMVRLAWGAADQVFTRVSDNRKTTVWGYTRIRRYPDMTWFHVPAYYIDSSGRQMVSFRTVWVDRDLHESYTVARIEFVDGHVTAFEQLNDPGTASGGE